MSKEFCAGVRILIERMQTNPEDFAEDDMDLATMRRTRMHKFGRIAKMLEALVTGRRREDVLVDWAEWHYLTKEEQAALIDAFKNMRRVEFDKRIMERVFDDKFYERQEEEERQYVFSKTQQAQLQAQVQANKAAQGVITAGQPGALYYYDTPSNISSTSQNGFLGSLGRALGFK
jgi:hypothetical protein